MPNFNNKAVLDRIRELFTKGLQKNTGWGRNEIEILYDKCVTQTLMEMLDA